ncbi:MAG: hypothetical protein ACKVE4_11545 [Dissulfuribacterales bacterium]
MKIQEAIMEKNALKSKLKNVVSSFEFIFDGDNLSVAEKDRKNIISKSFGVLSQYTQLQAKIALKNSQVKVEFNSKSMTLIELILHMQMLRQKVDILKEIKSKIQDSYNLSHYDSAAEPNPSILYEKRKLTEKVSEQIESVKEELRSAQSVLEKTNWTEDI